MSVNSNFVLRWEIKNATAKSKKGKAESGVFNEGGFIWTAKAQRDSDGIFGKFSLSCAFDLGSCWKCEADVVMRFLKPNEKFYSLDKERFCFNESSNLWTKKVIGWNIMTTEWTGFNINDKVTVEFLIHIINSERLAEDVFTKFAAPNSKNVVVKIGDKKLHVSKELLSIHSPDFEDMFFGGFDENGNKEVEIKEVFYQEFIDLLNVVYVQTVGITDRTVPHILKLADRFQMKSIVELARNHLTQSKEFDTVQKLIMADQYRLTELRDHCLNSFKSIAELTGKLKPSPEVANSSDQMKLAIFDRIWGLKLQ